MNVFFCDRDPVLAARALADRHVVKMPLETAQILSTVVALHGGDTTGLYKPTHERHPVTWATCADSGYRSWVAAHGFALADEYTRRFGRTHGSLGVLQRAFDALGAPELEEPWTFAICVPDEHLVPDDPVTSYRRALAAKYAAWGDAARWTNATRPTWADLPRSTP